MTDVAIDGHLVPVEGPPATVVPVQQVLPSEVTPPLSEAPQTIVEQDRQEHEHSVPDTVVPIRSDTTVVVQTNDETVRDYALMFRMHLSNGTKKITGFVSFIKGRLGEKTTYIFLGTGVAAASALPVPWSFMSMGLSFIAAMVPDHVIQKDGSSA